MDIEAGVVETRDIAEAAAGSRYDRDGLRPEMAEIVAAAVAVPGLDHRTTPVRRQRRAVEMAAAVWNTPALPCGVADLMVPTPAGRMRARLYRPAEADFEGIVLHAHGGGWTFGSIDTHDGLIRRLARALHLPVLSIDYRLAPEHPHPAPLEDTLAAFAFLESGGVGEPVHADRIVVAGDSAGAQTVLAALLARRDAGRPAAAAGLLFYGCFAPDFDTESHRLYGGDGSFLLSTDQMRWFWDNHLAGAADPGLTAPLWADLAGLPPLFLDAASHDPLRDDTLHLAAKLAAAGVPHRLKTTEGVTHGYLRYGAKLPAVDETFAAAAAFLGDMAGL